MNKITYLLPRNFRFVGIFFLIIGIIIGVARFKFGFKPDALDLKMFAFYSSFIESKYMEIVKNNLGEELTGLFIISGLFFIAFARENEEFEATNILRLKAFFLSAYSNFFFLLFAFFFTFGFAFIYMLMLNIGFGLLAYIVSFRILLWISKSKKPDRSINQ
jgi:hypothetical protein